MGTNSGVVQKYNNCLAQNTANVHEDSFDKLGKVLFFFIILMERNAYLAQLDFLQWPILIVLLLILMTRLIFKNRILNDFAFVWMITFTLCVVSSFAWAFDTSKVIADVKYMIKAVVVLSYALYIVKKDKKLEFIISSIVIATVISVAMILPNIAGLGNQIVSRAEIIIMGVEINVNQVCPDIAFATIFLIYLFKNEKRRFYQGIYIGLMLAFVLTICFLGSRSSLLVVIGGVMLTALTGSNRKILRNVLFAIILMVIMIVLVMRVPILYDAIGDRIVDTINLLVGNEYVSENQRSDNLRMQLIMNGWDMFKKRPLLGYGAGNYANVNLEYYGLKHYAHNNYIELLASLGIVGTLIYYSFHVKILFQTLKTKISNRSNRMNLAVQLVLCMLVLDVMYVTYNVMNMWLCLVIAYAGVALEKYKNS